MEKTKKILIYIFILFILIIPIFSLADFVGPCPEGTHNDGTACVPDEAGGTGLVPACEGKDCNWDQLMTLVDNILNFLLNVMVIPIAAIMFAYAGFLLVTSGGDPGRRSKAKSIFINVLIGLIIAVGAWALVKLLLTTLNYAGPGLHSS